MERSLDGQDGSIGRGRRGERELVTMVRTRSKEERRAMPPSPSGRQRLGESIVHIRSVICMLGILAEINGNECQG